MRHDLAVGVYAGTSAEDSAFIKWSCLVHSERGVLLNPGLFGYVATGQEIEFAAQHCELRQAGSTRSVRPSEQPHSWIDTFDDDHYNVTSVWSREIYDTTTGVTEGSAYTQVVVEGLQSVINMTDENGDDFAYIVQPMSEDHSNGPLLLTSGPAYLLFLPTGKHKERQPLTGDIASEVSKELAELAYEWLDEYRAA